MKRIRISSIVAIFLAATSCHYLDIAPTMGLEESEVFSKYKSYMNFLDAIYDGDAIKDQNSKPLDIEFTSMPIRQDANEFRFTFACMTDLADAGRQGLRCETIKAGTLGENCNFLVDYRCPVFEGGWHLIRCANKCIENIDMLLDAPEEEKYDILGQAYFLRAWFHMNITNYFGGQPYLDHPLREDEPWDVPRLPAVETYKRCAEDFQKAYEMFQLCNRVRRDAGPGKQGHLNNSKQNRPNGVAALALKGRCLLYAASPLHNTTNDPELWREAAEANSEALNEALKYEYSLLPWDQWENNTAFVAYTNEQLWAWNYGAHKSDTKLLLNILCYAIHSNSTGGGQNPTQNAVDLYETIWGDPLFSQAERDAAYNLTDNDEGSLGPDGKHHHYYEQDPYSNRDPRLYKNVIFDGATAVGVDEDGIINMYFDPESNTYPPTMLSGRARSFGVVWNSANRPNTTTGYYTRKRWDGKYVATSYQITDPIIRLAEVYLSYAEAANMAYGPNGGVPGQITALEAVNIVRHRAGMPDVQSRFTSSKESLNERIQNERTVELMFECNHYYIDERRWKIAPERMGSTLYGMYVEKCPVDAEHPNGKLYIRKPIVHQSTWKDAMYYWYLYKEEAKKYQYYENNPSW